MGLISIIGFWKFFGAFFLGFHGFCSSDEAPSYPFVQNANTAPAIAYYDYIIVGGGTAGCPLAATLSQDTNLRILVLERGGSPYGNPNITYLANFGAALSDLSPSSPSQRFISGDGVINARARVLGGGSCLNAGFYSRASPEYVLSMGWDGRLVNESYEWVEDEVAFEPTMRQWQTSVRDGLIEVGVTPDNGFTYDHINGTKIGGTIFDQHGFRHTAADLFIYAKPSNLTVLLHASVHRILFRRRGGPKPRARGVLYRDEAGKRHRAYITNDTRNEIIISAGALGSPQLLILSGVGPIGQLRAHNISSVMEQPMVGQTMSDNPMNAVFVPSPLPVEISLIQVVGITQSGTYIEAASGANFAGGVTSRDYGMFSPKIGQLSTVPPKERTPEALAKAIELMQNLDESAFRGGFILEKIMGPISTGHLEITSRDPNDNPSVTFNYFQDPQDLQRCIDGISIIEKVIESKAFSRFKLDTLSTQQLLNMTAFSPINLLPKHANTSLSPEQFCKDTVMTIWHYHGGCQVGSVVDSDYRVVGLDNIRVIDGSTFKDSPGTNPQATVMMLGRYMGVTILRGREGTTQES